MLWTDKETMDEFFELDPINEDFYEVFVTFREEPFGVQLDAVKVFNEVYYQVTRMVYEHALPADLPKFVNDIKANLGWSYGARLVISMGYFLFLLSDSTKNPINRLTMSRISLNYHHYPYWQPLKECYERLRVLQRSSKYSFVPCPNNATEFKGKYIQWSTITQKYNLSCIEHVLNLWPKIEDKCEIANMIKESLSSGSFISRYGNDYKQIYRFFDQYFKEDSLTLTCAEDSPKYYTYKDYQKLSEKAESEMSALQKRISELESENESLKALLEKKKINGKARRFTLVEIVDYCKGRVEWDDAKDIVAMLNRLLRKKGTQEDSDLVDSIEEEFRQRRYGNTFNAPVGQIVQHADIVDNKKL